MEVHHHSSPAPGGTHTPRKKWTHYLWEFLMLFLAVFCGFLAENQREHMVEHKRAGIYARQLIQEIEPDTAEINIAIHFISDKEKSVDSLIYFLKSNSPSSWKRIYFHVAGLDVYYLPVFQKAAFDQIKNSGSLRYFSKSLTNAIQQYANNIELVESYQNYIRSFFDQRLTPFLGKNFDQEMDYYTRRSDYNRFLFDSLWEKSAKPSRLLSGETNALTEFKNLLFEIKTATRIRNTYARYKESAETLAGMIQKEYHLK